MKALEEHKLFEGCSSEFLEVMLREAKRRHIAPGEVLRLADCGSLFLIESGAVRFEAPSPSRGLFRCQVGEDQFSVQGMGTFVNGAGFLRLLNEAVTEKGSRGTCEARVYRQRNPTGAPIRPRRGTSATCGCAV